MNFTRLTGSVYNSIYYSNENHYTEKYELVDSTIDLLLFNLDTVDNSILNLCEPTTTLKVFNYKKTLLVNVLEILRCIEGNRLIMTGKEKPNLIDKCKRLVFRLIDICKESVGFVCGNDEDHDNDYTALHLACEHEWPDIALALIATGYSNPTQLDVNGETALHTACKNKMTPVVHALLDVLPMDVVNRCLEELNPDDAKYLGDNVEFVDKRNKKNIDIVYSSKGIPDDIARHTKSFLSKSPRGGNKKTRKIYKKK